LSVVGRLKLIDPFASRFATIVSSMMTESLSSTTRAVGVKVTLPLAAAPVAVT